MKRERRQQMSEEMNIESREKLKSYLTRLGSGEDIESVRADFVKNFSDVDPSEIMKAEQELIKEGTPLNKVQKLCDIHSALFRGKTREEKIANAEKAVEASLREKKAYADKNAMAKSLEAINGHPLNTLTKENEALTSLIKKYRETDDRSLLESISELYIHYAKKGDLIYPLLKVKYGISGPSDVMWTVDDEIRHEIKAILKDDDLSKNKERIEAVLKRMEEMIYKEQNILFPIAAVNFTEEEWEGIYRDAKDYGTCLGVTEEKWEDAENKNDASNTMVPSGDEIVLPGGHFKLEELRALLNTIPIEISFVDSEDMNRFFNEGPKLFKRPQMAVDRSVYSCHPPKIEPMVRKIISEFKNGEKDEVAIWSEKNGIPVLVKYTAVRDNKGNYLGTAEFVQNMEIAKEHFNSKDN
jgi:DUF438 domain-containing protein